MVGPNFRKLAGIGCPPRHVTSVGGDLLPANLVTGDAIVRNDVP